MESLKRRWKKVPVSIRRPVVFIIGSLFIIGAVLTGWLPGPGGIPLFLIGVAILATEFERAERFRDWVLGYAHMAGHWLKKHRVLGMIFIIFGIVFGATLAYISYKKLHG